MERLKAVLADKILDISTGSGEEVRIKIDKIQRFRDFANACQTLMIKYPAIEDELIKMVEAEDFDTKVASSRVDSVIRLADTSTVNPGTIIIPPVDEPLKIEEGEESNKVEEMSDIEVADPDLENELKYTTSVDDIPMEIIHTEDENIYQQEDIDAADLEYSSEIFNEDYLHASKESAITLVSEERLDASLISDAETEPDSELEATVKENEQAPVIHIHPNDEDAQLSDEERAAHRKVIIKRTIQVIAIVAIVVALIFIIKFVMSHWQTILIIAGVLAILAILFFLFRRKR
ncbi:transmembrane domain-containing protein [Prevotella sp. 10(H)]|uniref:EGFR-like transmembrane domain-containing protein n=1 Tax=Prevotella sp. 10(H) TaxID=1158294 RepID=UPI0004A71565|nr:transmembrane domain-containing protein [Prevotella sp. 10(H)]